jgi:hypothetical protein
LALDHAHAELISPSTLQLWDLTYGMAIAPDFTPKQEEAALGLSRACARRLTPEFLLAGTCSAVSSTSQ